jgi:putative ABC transport system permease protein
VFTLFAAFAIFVSFLGLYGLSSYSTLRRTKEIGVRKVLGANVSSIIYLLSKEFLILVVLGNLIAWPVTYFAVQGWLDSFASHIEPGVGIYIASTFVVIAAAAFAVGYRTITAASANPVNALRSE